MKRLTKERQPTKQSMTLSLACVTVKPCGHQTLHNHVVMPRAFYVTNIVTQAAGRTLKLAVQCLPFLFRISNIWVRFSRLHLFIVAIRSPCKPRLGCKYGHLLLIELSLPFFYVLLTVHLSITLVNDQLDAQFFYFIIPLLQSSTCFEQRRAHHQEV